MSRARQGYNGGFRKFLGGALGAWALALILTACAGAPAKPAEPTSTAAATGRAAPKDSIALPGAPPPAIPAPEPSPAAGSSSKPEADSPKKAVESSRAASAEESGPEFIVSGDALPRPSSRVSKATPEQSGLKAGYSDDNEQFNYFVKFLDEYRAVPHFGLSIDERIAVRVADSEGRAVANAEVGVSVDGELVAKGRTYADGLYYLYPLELPKPQAQSYEVEASADGRSSSASVSRTGPRSVSLALGAPRLVPSPLPVDVLFVLDTTGSMGEEIERLRSTIEIISANITALKPKPSLRFGMVLYRDRDDEYDTTIVPFTANLDAFQRALDETNADGGGDEPEDLQAALRDAVGAMKWNQAGIRLCFIVTDASPHLDYGQDYNYASAARDAKAKGIKLFSIGAGGLPIEGEYVLRQLAQYTQGKYIFLTYGEGGESAGGKEGSVSHHTGSNFSTDKLEAIVIKFVRDEIARQSDKPIETEESFNAARKVDDETREDTLSKLFSQALQDLSDYSSLRLGPESKLAIMPLAVAKGSSGEDSAAQAEYFGSQLSLAASSSKLFTIVERKDLQSILSELELQLSGLADEDNAARAGKLLGAEFLVTGTVFRGSERYELFLKLLRVETAEVLAATKARVDLKLGL